MWTPRRPGSRRWRWPGGCPCRRSCWTAIHPHQRRRAAACGHRPGPDHGPAAAAGRRTTGNLDSENSDNIIDLLLKLAHDENRCVIVVTHDLSVMDRADVVYRINDGLLERR